jgi:hypothetical protein
MGDKALTADPTSIASYISFYTVEPRTWRTQKESMSSELAMNAYVLLGNALKYFVSGIGAPAESGISAAMVRDLYTKIEPQPPARIVQALADLTPDERSMLARLCRYVILETASKETETILGLPSEIIDQTLVELGLRQHPTDP